MRLRVLIYIALYVFYVKSNEVEVLSGTYCKKSWFFSAQTPNKIAAGQGERIFLVQDNNDANFDTALAC